MFRRGTADEFFVILEGVRLTVAIQIADPILMALRSVSITASVVSPGGADGRSNHEQIEFAAEQQMQRAKRDGRNCVRWSPDVIEHSVPAALPPGQTLDAVPVEIEAERTSKTPRNQPRGSRQGDPRGLPRFPVYVVAAQERSMSIAVCPRRASVFRGPMTRPPPMPSWRFWSRPASSSLMERFAFYLLFSLYAVSDRQSITWVKRRRLNYGLFLALMYFRRCLAVASRIGLAGGAPSSSALHCLRSDTLRWRSVCRSFRAWLCWQQESGCSKGNLTALVGSLFPTERAMPHTAASIGCESGVLCRPGLAGPWLRPTTVSARRFWSASSRWRLWFPSAS